MAYIDATLAPCAGFGWQGGSEFKTQIVELQSGRERRNGMWSQGRHRFVAPFLNISVDAYRSLKALHQVCRGQLHAFRFRDELDYQADQEVFGIGDGTTEVFQLSKTSLIDGIQYTREVYAPDDPVVITSDNVLVTGVTIDYRRGTVTFAVPPTPGKVLRWTGDFSVWVRFTQDFLPFTLDAPGRTNGSVDLLEVAPPGQSE